VKDLVSLTSHGVRNGSGAACSKWKSKILEGNSGKQWDLASSVVLNFICIAGDGVMIHFRRKRYISASTTRAIRQRNRGMKSLEIQNILKSVAFRRWNLGSMDEIYQVDRHNHLPEVEKKN
jgi:hypothetical protein